MNSKLKTVLAAMGMGLALTSLSASAGVTWYSPLTGFQDDNLEWFFNNDGSVNGVGNPTLTVGDTLVSVVEIAQSYRILPPGAASGFGGDELTGIVAVDVTGKVASGFPGLFNFTFGPAALGLGAYDPNCTDASCGAGGGAVAAFYLDPTPNLDLVAVNCASLAACVAAANDGSKWEIDGFAGDPDEYWVAVNAFDNIAVVASAPSASNLGTFNFAGSVLYNGTGKLLFQQACPLCLIFGGVGANGMIDVVGSGNLLGGQGLANGAVARSDLDFQKAVPEPGTLALLATGLLGLGYSLRKRND